MQVVSSAGIYTLQSPIGEDLQEQISGDMSWDHVQERDIGSYLHVAVDLLNRSSSTGEDCIFTNTIINFKCKPKLLIINDNLNDSEE